MDGNNMHFQNPAGAIILLRHHSFYIYQGISLTLSTSCSIDLQLV